ncbi:Lrp/AsnC ligand binding domain-containing protein [Ornithinimicrobium cerasi]|uniref:Transcriptional regulator, AsnC family n=1 Tax=Ornithinimicrobium cerasi TaxID=2248773 RepID=A0A285VM86_9MICO|nr:Lrp/AsnC ligand binding domain-containing protein [Ornithinimicrobium cerasi]SOC55179.1 transcriptional regulator, AsnC family [Ornithinimicrobium cerasi]
MIRAYILIQTEVGASATVTTAVRELPGVESAEDVAGPYDVIAVVTARTVQELGREVIAKVQAVPRITRTTTCTVVEF